MPEHKGIRINIVSQWELQPHQEFPHPESSQFTNRSPNVGGGNVIEAKLPSGSPDSKADRLLGRQSSVSVYIPSMPGSRFWIRYSILDPSSMTSKWFYFKLYINGRHITSWGTNTQEKPSGQVMRALFDPCDRWNYHQSGVTYKNCGTEAREFFFLQEEEGLRSAAEDGGLIEVRVFRARGRQRKLAQPVPFTPQDVYGILMPSGGLIDQPQDAKFYDWHLQDPKDVPFTTFMFHYRSWESLITLHLIPEDHPRHWNLPSPSTFPPHFMSDLPESPSDNDLPIIFPDDIQLPSPLQDVDSHRDSSSSNNSATPWMTNVFDDSPQSSSKGKSKDPRFTIPRKLVPPPPQSKVPTSRFSKGFKQQSYRGFERLEVGGMERPLPDIPTAESRASHSRHTSTASGAISITPSLIQYIDRDDVSPPPVTGIAFIVPIGRSAMDEEFERDDPAERSQDYPDIDDTFNMKPLPLSILKKDGVPSPARSGLFSMPNISIRKSQVLPIKSLPKYITSPDINRYGENTVDVDGDDEENIANMTTISMTESEWLCKTPSPIRDDPEHIRVQNLWSPGVGEQRGRPKEGGSLRKKAMNWYEGLKNSTEHESSPENTGSGEVKIKGGNWI